MAKRVDERTALLRINQYPGTPALGRGGIEPRPTGAVDPRRQNGHSPEAQYAAERSSYIPCHTTN